MENPAGSQSKSKKAAKGSVQVKAIKGRLRLVWSFVGKRYFLSLEVEDSPLSRKVAEAKAKLIEADIISGNFDQSLEKYKPESRRKSSIQVSELVESFLTPVAVRVPPQTVRHRPTDAARSRTIASPRPPADNPVAEFFPTADTNPSTLLKCLCLVPRSGVADTGAVTPLHKIISGSRLR
jgi:hypothetical protein